MIIFASQIATNFQNITKRVYISFTLKSEFNLSQIKYGSRYNTPDGIIEKLRANLAFLYMEKYNSQKEESIGFFLGVNPKLTLRKALKQNLMKSVFCSILMMKTQQN